MLNMEHVDDIICDVEASHIYTDGSFDKTMWEGRRLVGELRFTILAKSQM